MRLTQLLGTAVAVFAITGVADAQTAASKATQATKQEMHEAGSQTKDAWLTVKTKIALMTADKVDAMDLNVDTRNAVVTLHGKVATETEKGEAERVARGIDGVQSVTNLLQVVPEAKRKAVNASDDQVKHEVSTALDAEPLLKDSSIKVASVNNGVVLLKGEAKTYAAHLKALEVARGVSGVKRLSSEVTVNDASATSSTRKPSAY